MLSGIQSQPILRYVMGDWISLTTSPCACGRTHARAIGGADAPEVRSMLHKAPTPARCFHLLEEIALRSPFFRYQAAFRQQPFSFLLDSAKDPEKLGQYSFISGAPFLIFEAKRLPG